MTASTWGEEAREIAAVLTWAAGRHRAETRALTGIMRLALGHGLTSPEVARIAQLDEATIRRMTDPAAGA